MMKYRIFRFKETKKWSWGIVGNDGKIIATSSVSFDTKSDCESVVHMVLESDIAGTVIEGVDDDKDYWE